MTAATGGTYGGRFFSASANGRGVFGYAFADTGFTYGVVGQANSPANGYGVYSNGRFAASGTKAFRIDHPDDPANKYLLHYSTESPEVLNTYSGTIMLDGAGEAAPMCSFRIAGGKSGAKVSWEVKAVRNDRWVQQRGAPVEVEKQDLERGTYQHPELYGQPPEKGMNYDADRVRPSLPSVSNAAPRLPAGPRTIFASLCRR